MKKAIRKVTYKMKPSVSQEESLMDLLVHHHQLYNWALRDRIETYRDSNYGLNFHEQCKINTLWRNNRKAHGIFNANAQSEQVTLKRVALAFDGFFRRLKKGDKKAGFPRFKPFQRFKGWGYKAHGDGWKLNLKEKSMVLFIWLMLVSLRSEVKLETQEASRKLPKSSERMVSGSFQFQWSMTPLRETVALKLLAWIGVFLITFRLSIRMVILSKLKTPVTSETAKSD